VLKLITHRPLWLNILIGILLAAGLFTAFILSLNWLTNHGKSRTVPSIVGKKFDEAVKQLKKQGFDVVVQDSVYVDTLPKFTVIKQFPEADAVVKVNRNVYITVNRAVPPMIEMPNLVGYSFRNAEMILKTNNLKFGDSSFRSDFAKNAVLEQHYKGTPVAPGTKIRMGSVIDFVLGSGVGEEEFSVPGLVGMTYSNAKDILESNGLILVPLMVSPDITDTMNAYIYRQEPERFDDEGKKIKIRTGQMMNVWLSAEKPVIDSTKKLSDQKLN
jgi:eukaryotic-like serine/threonine-protein kinase